MYSKAIKAGLSAFIFFTTLSSPAFADSVRLRSHDGSVDILGQLISYENQIYTLNTPIGTLLFAAVQYRCDGLDCPIDAIQPTNITASRDVTAPKNLFVRVN